MAAIFKKKQLIVIGFSCLLALTPLASNAVTINNNDNAGHEVSSNGDDEIEYKKDPLERWNRAMFAFNDTFDIYFMKPIATLYNAIIPRPLNIGIHNFFNNLTEISNVANDLLQFRFMQLLNDSWRFMINTTFGLGGLIDMATRMNLPYQPNDFGLTLNQWGYQNTSYFVLPFLGPYTIRDSLGLAVDYFLFSPYPYIQPRKVRYEVLALLYLDRRANLLELEPVLEEAAINKYVFMRNAYMQHRKFQMEQLNNQQTFDEKNVH